MPGPPSQPAVRTERTRLPESMRAGAEAIADGSRTPAQPRDAATVVLLREGNRGPEVYLLRRHDRMAFAAGMAVFPGGGVDDADRTVDGGDEGWAGPGVRAWAGRLGCAEPTARGLVRAAVRETFEEAGVLLAGPDTSTVVDNTTGPDWEADREGLVANRLSLADVLARRGLVLRSDLLVPWTHWVTPEVEPRRYDTRFFVAVLPAGQRTRDVSTESDAVAWWRPADAVAAAGSGELGMMPPTVRTCEDMARLGSLAEALELAPARLTAAIVPRVVVDDDGVWLVTTTPVPP